jgi:hypothetical protein
MSQNVIRRKYWCCLTAWNTEVLHASTTAITNLEIRHNKEASSGANSGQPVRLSGVDRADSSLIRTDDSNKPLSYDMSGNRVATNFSDTTIGIRWRDFITSVQNQCWLRDDDSSLSITTEIQTAVGIFFSYMPNQLLEGFRFSTLVVLWELKLKTDARKTGSSDNPKWRPGTVGLKHNKRNKTHGLYLCSFLNKSNPCCFTRTSTHFTFFF